MCLIKGRQNFFSDNYIFLCAVLFGLINVDIFFIFPQKCYSRNISNHMQKRAQCPIYI